jgi:signal transduction histidine kinase
LSLAGPEIDEAYFAERRRIGQTHERIGLEPSWYLGAYALYLSLLTPLVLERFTGDMARAERCLMALQKLLLFDASLAMDDYIERRERDLEALNRELARSGRQLAHDLETKGAELRHTTERARAAEHLASIGTLVAGLAHEIGTPMGVIQGHAKLLEAKLSDEQAQWRLRTIQEQIARISKIIQSLLNMARPSRSARGPVQLAPLLDETLAFVREKLARRGISAQASYAEAGSVRADRERLQQVFLNLFLNAADAMPDGGVLGVTLAPRGEREVAVEVADTGCGIAETDLEHVFDPFFTTKTAGEGNGLGLSVVRGIVIEHGGAITVESRLGQGTRFRVVLPLA